NLWGSYRVSHPEICQAVSFGKRAQHRNICVVAVHLDTIYGVIAADKFGVSLINDHQNIFGHLFDKRPNRLLGQHGTGWVFGVHNITMRVRLVIAANMASKSNSALAVCGTITSLAPAVRITIG